MTSDDSWDNPESDEAIDLSGFITSSETQPVVVERRRKASSIGSAPSMAEGMTNAGPTTAPPPPMSSVGYGVNVKAEFKEGSFNNNFSGPELTNDKPWVHFVPWHVHDNATFPGSVAGAQRKTVLKAKMIGATAGVTGVVIQSGIRRAARYANPADQEKIFDGAMYRGAGWLMLSSIPLYLMPVMGLHNGAVAATMNGLTKNNPDSAFRKVWAKRIAGMGVNGGILYSTITGLRENSWIERQIFQGGAAAPAPAGGAPPVPGGAAAGRGNLRRNLLIGTLVLGLGAGGVAVVKRSGN